MHRKRLSLFCAATLALTATAAATAAPPRCDANNGGLTLPNGFCALVVANNVGRARHIVVRRNGDLYVAVNPSWDGSDNGRFIALHDNDGDGRMDRTVVISQSGGHGVALNAQENRLYLGKNDRVLRYKLAAGQLLPLGAPATIVSGLPDSGDHGAKTVLLSPQGDLFVNIGSGSNSCQQNNRADYSPGIDPCPELATRAGVWRFSLQVGQHQAQGTRFAKGIRNATALAFQPGTGVLWGVQNGRDQLYDNWSNLYTPQDDRVEPAEELIKIVQGYDNGWPYCYEDPRLGADGVKVLAPEYGGDGTERGRCRNVADSQMTLPAHWAPLGLLFYTGAQFPSAYRNDAFIAFHGARFPGPPQGPGYNVVRVHFQNHKPVSWEPFASGFQGNGTDLPGDARDRPVGLAQGPDGSLYVTSDQLPGRIFRIVYKGN